MEREEDLSTLIDLGLTLLEAKTYIALSVKKTASVKTISINAHIAKQDVYRIIPRLQAYGLAEKIVSTQTMYKAIPWKEGILTLLQNKAQVYDRLQQRATKLISKYNSVNFGNGTSEEEAQFHIICEKNLINRTLDKITDRSQQNLDIYHCWDITREVLFQVGTGMLERAIKRGIKIRMITEKHENAVKVEMKLKTLTRYPLFEIRYVQPPAPIQILMYDRKEAIIGLSNKPEARFNVLWANNKVLVEALANYFDQTWNFASPSSSSEETKLNLKQLLC